MSDSMVPAGYADLLDDLTAQVRAARIVLSCGPGDLLQRIDRVDDAS